MFALINYDGSIAYWSDEVKSAELTESTVSYLGIPIAELKMKIIDLPDVTIDELLTIASFHELTYSFEDNNFYKFDTL